MASIDKRADGKWRARWREYPGGPQKSKHFRRKQDAESHLVSVRHAQLSGAYVSPEAGQVTVEEYAAEWQRRRHWRAATRDRIERELRLHIIPKLGDRPLASLRRSHIEEWVAQLPLGASSAAIVFQTLQAMLSAAVDDERIPKNPAKGARLPEIDAAPIVPISVEEVRAWTHHTPEHVRAAVVLGAGTGLRQGEAFGLTEDRVDFMRRTLRVDQQLWTPKKGRPYLVAPKAPNSYREIALSTLVVDTLAAHLEAFGTGEHDLIFHIDGRAVGRAMVSKYVRQATTRAGIEGRTWHDLRHHHASILLSNGVSPPLVAERLGHDVKTLLGTYAHVIRADEDRVRGIVDSTLAGSAEDWLRTKAS